MVRTQLISSFFCELNHLIGLSTIIAGTLGQTGSGGDGSAATTAMFSSPVGLATNTAGNVYVSDMDVHKVRLITVISGIISLTVGTGISSASATAANGDSGSATAATLNQPAHITCDTNNFLYIADSSNHKIRKVASGTITTFAGSGLDVSSDGLATTAGFYRPYGVWVGTTQKVYVTERNGNKIRSIQASGTVITIAGML